jgi:hypothetical protein
MQEAGLQEFDEMDVVRSALIEWRAEARRFGITREALAMVGSERESPEDTVALRIETAAGMHDLRQLGEFFLRLDHLFVYSGAGASP